MGNCLWNDDSAQISALQALGWLGASSPAGFSLTPLCSPSHIACHCGTTAHTERSRLADVPFSPSWWIICLHMSRNQHSTRHMGRVYKIKESSESKVDILVTDSSEQQNTKQLHSEILNPFGIPFLPALHMPHPPACHQMLFTCSFPQSWGPWLWSLLSRQWDWAFLSVSFTFWQISRFW